MSDFTIDKLSSTCYARVIDWLQQLAAGESEHGISEYLVPGNDINTAWEDAFDDIRNQQSKINLFKELRAREPAGARLVELNKVWDGMETEAKILDNMTKKANNLTVEKRLVDKGFGTVTAWIKSTVEEELRTVVLEEEAKRSTEGISRALMHKRIKNRIKDELGGNPQATRISIREGLHSLPEMSTYQHLRENVMEIHRIYLLLEAHVQMYGGTAAAVDADYTQALKRAFSKNTKTLMGPMITLQQAGGGETWPEVRAVMNKLINQELSTIPAKSQYQANTARRNDEQVAFAAVGEQGQAPQDDQRRKKRDRSSSKSRSKSRGREEAGSTPRGVLRGGRN
jgi:hypothetical protein